MSKATASEIKVGDVVNFAIGKARRAIPFTVEEITSGVSRSGRVVTTLYGTRSGSVSTCFSLLDGDTVELLAR
jgi:methyl coenzyme M reductase subunit C